MFKSKWTKADVKYLGLGTFVIVTTSYALYQVTTKVQRVLLGAIADHYYPTAERPLTEK